MFIVGQPLMVVVTQGLDEQNEGDEALNQGLIAVPESHLTFERVQSHGAEIEGVRMEFL